MTTFEQPAPPLDQPQASRVPAFLEGNPEGIAAYLRGLAKGAEVMADPDAQKLPMPILNEDIAEDSEISEGKISARAVLGSRAVQGRKTFDESGVTEVYIGSDKDDIINPEGRSASALRAQANSDRAFLMSQARKVRI